MVGAPDSATMRSARGKAFLLALVVMVVLISLHQSVAAVLRAQYLGAIPSTVLAAITAGLAAREAREVGSARAAALGLLGGFLGFAAVAAVIRSIALSVHPPLP